MGLRMALQGLATAALPYPEPARRSRLVGRGLWPPPLFIHLPPTSAALFDRYIRKRGW